jgi:microcystin-dependent protein
MIIGSVTTLAFNVGATFFEDTLNRVFCRCDGRSLNKIDYPILYRYIGDRYSDGTQTGAQFRIPDLRGSFLRGTDPNAVFDTDASSRTIDGPGNTSSDTGSRQNRGITTHAHSVATDDGVSVIHSRRDAEPTGSVLANDIHANSTDPRFPTYPTIGSANTNSTPLYPSSPEPTGTSSPNHLVCDYIIRVA